MDVVLIKSHRNILAYSCFSDLGAQKDDKTSLHQPNNESAFPVIQRKNFPTRSTHPTDDEVFKSSRHVNNTKSTIKSEYSDLPLVSQHLVERGTYLCPEHRS